MQRTPKTGAQPRLLIKVQNAPKKRHLRDESEKPLQKAVISHFVKNVLKTRSIFFIILIALRHFIASYSKISLSHYLFH